MSIFLIDILTARSIQDSFSVSNGASLIHLPYYQANKYMGLEMLTYYFLLLLLS